MWIKKIFGKPPPPPVPYPDKPNESKPFDKENEEVDGDGQSLLIDNSPDTRYDSDTIIEHNSTLKFPIIALHTTEAIFIEETNLISARKSNTEDAWSQIDIMVSDRQIIITPNIFQELGKSTLNYFALSYGHI